MTFGTFAFGDLFGRFGRLGGKEILIGDWLKLSRPPVGGSLTEITKVWRRFRRFGSFVDSALEKRATGETRKRGKNKKIQIRGLVFIFFWENGLRTTQNG